MLQRGGRRRAPKRRATDQQDRQHRHRPGRYAATTNADRLRRTVPPQPRFLSRLARRRLPATQARASLGGDRADAAVRRVVVPGWSRGRGS